MTSMGELALRRVPDEDKQSFGRLIDILDDNYPEDWRTWEVEDIPIAKLFDGDKIDPKVEAKLRFAIPTAELAMAFDEPSLSEKKFRAIKRKLLEWPLGRALIYAPHSIMESIHTGSYEQFIGAVKILKPKLTSREVAAGEPSRKRNSASPSGSSANKTPRRDNQEFGTNPHQLAFFETMMSVLSHQTKALENVVEQVSALAAKSETAQSELDQSFESLPDSTQEDSDFEAPSLNVASTSFKEPVQNPPPGLKINPASNATAGPSSAPDVVPVGQEAALIAQIAAAQKQLADLKTRNGEESKMDCDFSPQTTEAEPKFAKADPQLAEQGRKCQRLGEENWKNVRYADVQKTFHATPVFSALKVNSLLAPTTPSWMSLSHLEKTDTSLGAITYGLLLQRKAFQEACKNLDPQAQQEIQKHFLNPDCTFRKLSDGLLQYTCGRRAEIIQLRRETYKSPNKVLNDILHDIPPSETHLFSEQKLTEAVKDQGGAHKFFPKKLSSNYKSEKKAGPSKNSKTYREQSSQGKFQSKKQTRNFRYPGKQAPNNNKAKPNQSNSKKA